MRKAKEFFGDVKPVLEFAGPPVFGLFLLAVVIVMLILTGCATEKIAEGLSVKNTSGNGLVVDSHIGVNTETKVPELRTLFISGDIATVKAGTNSVSYREESSASVWNASSITKKRFLAITLSDDGDIPATIKAVADVLNREEKEKGTENGTVQK